MSACAGRPFSAGQRELRPGPVEGHIADLERLAQAVADLLVDTRGLAQSTPPRSAASQASSRDARGTQPGQLARGRQRPFEQRLGAVWRSSASGQSAIEDAQGRAARARWCPRSRERPATLHRPTEGSGIAQPLRHTPRSGTAGHVGRCLPPPASPAPLPAAGPRGCRGRCRPWRSCGRAPEACPAARPRSPTSSPSSSRWIPAGRRKGRQLRHSAPRCGCRRPGWVSRLPGRSGRHRPRPTCDQVMLRPWAYAARAMTLAPLRVAQQADDGLRQQPRIAVGHDEPTAVGEHLRGVRRRASTRSAGPRPWHTAGSPNRSGRMAGWASRARPRPPASARAPVDRRTCPRTARGRSASASGPWSSAASR